MRLDYYNLEIFVNTWYLRNSIVHKCESNKASSRTKIVQCDYTKMGHSRYEIDTRLVTKC